MRSLSIIIPAYNEETRLPATLDRILEYLREREWAFIEVLVVDDGSKDRTAEIVRQYSSRAAAVQLISNPGNRGKGYAVRNGMLQAKGVWRLITDSDLSAPIEELDKLWAAAEKEKALVSFGSRALDRSLVSVHQPLARELSGRIFNLVMRLVMRLPFRDTQCGFKLYHAEAAAKIFPRQGLDGFGFDVEDLFLARKLGLKAVEVPVRWANVEGTRVSLTSGVKAFWDLVAIRWRQLVGRYR
ncbi:MAG: glycosyltransferase family 2 protein [Bryobacterales bacterium]|nr:glycosyltransferase family 2 protein [Bryobacterales bacterium]